MTDTPAYVELARECIAAGLTVTELMPMRCRCGCPDEYSVQLWTPEGTLWAEGRNESAELIRWHIDNYLKRNEASND